MIKYICIKNYLYINTSYIQVKPFFFTFFKNTKVEHESTSNYCYYFVDV